MFQKRSFNLISEEEFKKTESPNSWVRFIVIPGIISFVLLVILINVDFSGNAYDDFGKTSIVTTTDYLTSTAIFEDSTKSEFSADNDYSTASISKVAETVKGRITEPILLSSVETSPSRFQETIEQRICTLNNNGCTLECSVTSRDLGLLNLVLETQHKICQHPIELTLSTTTDTVHKDLLNGEYRLDNLTFQIGGINKIADNGFDSPSLNNLKRLIIMARRLNNMNDYSFNGLHSLQYFHLYNEMASNRFVPVNFLKPMPTTLTQIYLNIATNALFSYNPANWFDGGNFVNVLDVDLSNNYFTASLNSKSFESLVSVKRLNLENCNIQYLSDNTFKPIVDTLQYLDLRNNKLTNLSPEMIITLKGQNIQFVLSSNSWDCNCNNFELIEAIKQNKIQLTDQTICSTPPELKDTELKNVDICCIDDEGKCKGGTEENPSTITPNPTESSSMNPTVRPTTTSAAVSTTTSIVDTTTEPTTITETITTAIEITTPSTTTNVELVCKKPEGGVSTTTLQKPDAIFKIKQNSPISITIEFSAFPKNLSLIYFTNDKTQKSVKILLNNLITEIKDLTPDQAYVFCIVSQTKPTQHISPFNCRSHYMPPSNGSDDFSAAWLYSSDIPLFLSLALIGVIVFLLVGLFGTYFLLRWRPTLMRGSRRLRRVSSDSKRVVLTKKHLDFSPEEVYDGLRQYTSTYHGANQTNISDNRQYPKNITYDQVTELEENNLPPQHQAPPIPRPISLVSTLPADSVCSLSTITEDIEDHEYQSLEQYGKQK